MTNTENSRSSGGGSAHAEGPDADDRPLEAVVETVRHGIDQVADKVKGLLRSGR